MRKHSSFRFRVCALLLVFYACVFLLPACRGGDPVLYMLSAAVPGSMLLLLLLPSGLFAPDRPSLAVALILCGFSMMATVYLSVDETVSQGIRCAAGLFFLALGAVLVRSFRPSVPAGGLAGLFGLGLLSLPLFISELSFSLSDGGMALLLLAVSAFLALRLRLPALLIGLGGILLLLFQKEFGSAAILAVSFAAVFWAASDSVLWSGFSLAAAGGLFAVFLMLPGWFVPKEPEIPSVLSRLSSMPLLPPETVPEASGVISPDLFFLLGEQYGIIILLCAVLLLMLLLIRGASLALHTRKSFHASLSLAAVLLFGLRAFAFLACSADLLPLPAPAFPLMTSSMPDLFTHFFLLGLLSGVSARNEADLEEDARLAMLAR